MEGPTDGSVLRESISSNQCSNQKSSQQNMEKSPWEDVEPIAISEEEFKEIFGSSSDEETEFYGFTEKELGLKEFRNVMSPNKLKFQDDFYMPLFLSHHKRNRDLASKKSEGLEKDTKKALDFKNYASTSKHARKSITDQDSRKSLRVMSKVDIENPYAKQYKSYRRNRTKSVPLSATYNDNNCDSEGKVSESNDYKVDLLSEAESRENASNSECQFTSDQQPNLKMKIHYESHVRPKRKVIVQEKDDYVYGITLPSKKRARTLSPTVITNAKILRGDIGDSNEEVLQGKVVTDDKLLEDAHSQKEPTYGESFTIPLLDLSKQIEDGTLRKDDDSLWSLKKKDETTFEIKGKRKKRFKNFRGTETQYPKAVFDNVVDGSKNEMNVATSKTVAGEMNEDLPVEVSKIETPKYSPETGDTKGESSSANMDNNLFSEASVVPDKEYQTGTKVSNNEVEKRLNEPNKDGLQIAKPEKKDSADDSTLIEKGNENVKQSKERKNVQKDVKKNSLRELRRKERPSTSFKPKDINLTDSWFIVSNKTTKKSSNSERSKSTSKHEYEHSDTRDSGKSDTSAANTTCEEGDGKNKASFVGKFLPIENRRSMTRRRRLKNVTSETEFTDNVTGTSVELDSGSQKDQFIEKQSTGGEKSNFLCDSSSNMESANDTDSKCMLPKLCHLQKKENLLQEHDKDASKNPEIDTPPVSTEGSKLSNIGDTISTKLSSGLHADNYVSHLVHEKNDSSCEIQKCQQDLQPASERPRSNKRLRSSSVDKTSALEVTFSTPIEMIEGQQFKVPLAENNDKNQEEVEARGVAPLRRDDNIPVQSKSTQGQKKDYKETEVDKKPVNGQDFSNRGIVDLTKISRKINRRFSKRDEKDLKNGKSGKSFIIKTPVDDTEKQITVQPTKQKIRRNSKGFYDDESDTDIDITAVDKEDGTDKTEDFKEVKVKRKIYTVVRKIRRTEINAEGKKVTKIIKQIVKKVCPVTNDFTNSDVAIGKKGDATEKEIKDGDNYLEGNKQEGTKTADEKSQVSDKQKVKPRPALSRKCGKCAGCLRKEDCKECEACSKKQEALPRKLNICCERRQCVEKYKKRNEKDTRTEMQGEKGVAQNKQMTKSKSILPSRNEMTVKSLYKLKPDGYDNEAPPATSKAVRPKSKSKGSKPGLKDMVLQDDVYAPGFRLRSKKIDVVKPKPNRILKEVKYTGMEPKVKLPWPEEQDEQSICSSGNFFCVTSPIDIATKDICFHCGSGGFSKMITCINCSEVYHEFCIEIDPLDEKNWFCDRCKRCHVCGYKDNLLMCDKCHDCYHAECLGPIYHKETEGVDDSWVCAKCVKCEKCGAKTPGKRKESKWMKDFTLCEECNRRMERGQFCLICENVYSENDYDTKMMYCSNCCKWIHMECEGLTIDEYECLAELPEEVPYVCKLCHNSEVWPRWYQEVREEIQAGFEKTYYEIIASSDMKIVKRHLPEFQSSEAQQRLDDILKTIQVHGFSTVEQFVSCMKKFIELLSTMIDGVLPDQIVTDLQSLLIKQIKSMFSWTEGLFKKPKKADIRKDVIDIGVAEKVEVSDNVLNAVLSDHAYNKVGIDNKDTEGTRNDETASRFNVDATTKSDIDSAGDENIFEKLLCREKGFPESLEEMVNDSNIDSTTMPPASTNDVKVNVGEIGKDKCPMEKYDEDSRSDMTSEKCDTMDNDDDVISSSKNSACEDETSQDGDNASLQGKMRTAKHIDDRRCLLCNQYGDEDEKDSGRILNAGINEWVHVNCALWSAEVYENDMGLLQNVHVAISRGQKLQCSTCQQWGATVGCCTSSCPSNYHFMCARNTAVTFQNDKLVFCPKHKFRSKNEVILEDKGFVVARPVMVDLSKVSNQKKFAADRDPDSITVYSGSVIVQRLGRLSESSNGEVLVPIGYRSTRLFWSSTDTSKRCKYLCSIDEVPIAAKCIKEKEDIFMGGITISHNVKSVKRKDMSSVEEIPQPLQKRQKTNDISVATEESKITTTSITLKSTSTTSTGISPVSSAVYSSKPLKIGKDPFEKYPSSQGKSTENPQVTKQTDSFYLAQSSVAGKTTINLQQTPKKQSTVFYHKSSPHKIIPQPGDLSSTYDSPVSGKKLCNISPKPRLIQPKLRYEVLPTVLQPDVSGSNTKRPILPKCDQPVVAIARHLQYHLSSNPQMLNYVGNTTLQGLNQVLGMTYQYPVSPLPLHVNSNRTITPCYTLNLPDAFWRTHAAQVHSSPSKHPFQVQRGPCAISKRNKTDSSCQTDSAEQNQGYNVDNELEMAKDLEKQKDMNDKDTASHIKRRLNGDSTTDKCQQILSTETKGGDTALNTDSSSNCNNKSMAEDGSANVLPHSFDSASDNKTLPNFNDLIDKLASTSQSKNGNTHDKNQIINKSSDEISPISLQNISELSCLQAAAQLAKLMPEIFNEKNTISSSEQNDAECPSLQLADSVSNYDTDSKANSDSVLSVVNNVGAESKSESKKNRKWYQKRMKKLLGSEKPNKSRLRITVKSEDGLHVTGISIQDVWKQILEILNETRTDQKLPPLHFNENEAFDFFGLANFPTLYLAEQLPGGHKCRAYKFQYHLPCTADEDKELPVNPHGCARAELYPRKPHSDMFAWLASPYRTLPQHPDEGENDNETSKTASDLPLSMRFRQLKNKVKDHVGVYRSLIDGRGLFCKRQIEASEMVIEYAGSVIRATLTDKRENYYEGKGYGCYMFRIDDTFVVDATLYGNEARFINHSCEPNCYSRIVPVDGEKHIVIFAARRIYPGEELTYDYKFPFEEEKIPCHCGSKKCRKYLN